MVDCDQIIERPVLERPDHQAPPGCEEWLVPLDVLEAADVDPACRLGRVLEGHGQGRLSDELLVARIAEVEALQAQLMTLQAQDLAVLRERSLSQQDRFAAAAEAARDADGWVAARVGWVLGLGEGQVRRRLDTADRLARFRGVADLTSDGLVQAWTAEKALEHLDGLSELVDDLTLQMIEAELVRWLSAQPRTVGALNRRMRRIRLRAEADAHDETDREAALAARHAQRDVRITSGGDGTASLWARLPEADALAVHAALAAATARARTDPEDARTLAQLRADALVATVTGLMACYGRPLDVPISRPATGTAVAVQLEVPVGTVVGTSQTPGEVPGYGPISADTVRDLLDASDLRFGALFYDHTTGQLLGLNRDGLARNGRTRGGAAADGSRRGSDARLDRTAWTEQQPTAPGYQHPVAMDRLVKARDRFCRAPGCARRARGCDIDHVTPWPTGETSLPNAVALCRHHHRLKTHAPGWHVHLDDDGGLTWTTPDGHRLTTEPHDYRPDDDPPPF